MPNRLAGEQSPYLLQHAHNPVDWYPWSDEAFERARMENKPVLVSIGYSACHWCHVMERESFEDEATAAYMNERFVCVKVDREEHPDVDHLYMDAVQAIAGNGGWPLNVFVTAERAPFYGGTYFPPRPAFNRPSWLQILQRMHEIWTMQHDEVATQSAQLLQHLRQASLKGSGTPAAADMTTCRQIADNLLKQADTERGGFGNAPKFPATMAISFLLEHYHYTGYQPALDHALRSLDAMIDGGIHDQLGGGFSRYSTDREWLAPHFEKMLYDNALMVIALGDAYMASGDHYYHLIIDNTIDFVERELKDPGGGYYSALDADSEGVEGKYYTWTWDEWQAALGGGYEEAARYFGVKPGGNWEGTNILHVATTYDAIVKEMGLDEDQAGDAVASARVWLLKAREERVRPGTDNKCLLSWNALMNLALVKASAVYTGFDPDTSAMYRDKAVRHMHWMLEAYDVGGHLKRVWKNGEARIGAKLEDYAYLVQALLQLTSLTGDYEWLSKAGRLMDTINEEFSAEDGFYYFTPASQQDIPVRKTDNYDGAMPSANAVMAHNLWLCGMCLDRPGWMERAERMLYQLGGTVSRYSYSFGYWACLLQRQAAGLKTVVCSGAKAAEMKKELMANWLPEAYMLTFEKQISDVPVLENKHFGGETHIFVCSGQSCLSPVSSVEEALRLLKSNE